MKTVELNPVQISAVFNFEVYVLMTMKLRLSLTSDPVKKLRLQNKLAEHSISVADGERIYDQMTGTLVDEDSFFTNLRTFLGVNTNDQQVGFSSVLWPEFDFKATTDSTGQLQSARYWHTRKSAVRPQFCSPRDIPTWSMDLEGFAEHFGPLNLSLHRPLFDDYLPNYEEHQFDWINEYGQTHDYGAGFCWGMFIFVGESWD